MRHPIVKLLCLAAFALLFLTACENQPVREKPVTVTVAQYVPLPATLTAPTTHYAIPDAACTFTATDGTVSHTYCVKQITDALAGEQSQVDACNADKACARALQAGEKCSVSP